MENGFWDWASSCKLRVVMPSNISMIKSPPEPPKYPSSSFTLRTGAGYDYFEKAIWFDIVRKHFS